MTKANTDEGLGPGSEPGDAVSSRSSIADGTPKKVDKNAVTEPGIGKVERKDDAVDQLLEGFGRSRPDLPRILPPADTTLTKPRAHSEGADAHVAGETAAGAEHHLGDGPVVWRDHSAWRWDREARNA